MKTSCSRNLITLTLLALAFVIGPFLRAQTPEATPAEQPPVTSVTATKSEPAKPESADKSVAAPETPANAAVTAEAAQADEEKKGETIESEKTEPTNRKKPSTSMADPIIGAIPATSG